MTKWFIAVLLFTLPLSLPAQNPPIRWLGGTDVPASAACDSASELGSIFVQTGDPASGSNQLWACRQTGASTYAWHPISHFSGTTLPATCTAGQIAIDTDAPTGQRLYACESGTWVLQIGIFNESGNLAIGTTDLDGTPAIGRLVVQGSTTDGSTNILVGRDSGNANVASLDTNGDFTLNAVILPAGDAQTQLDARIDGCGAGLAQVGSQCEVDGADIPRYLTGTATPTTGIVRNLYIETDLPALWYWSATDTPVRLQNYDANLLRTIDDEDTPLTQRPTLNFEGAGVTCADDTDQITCTIPGGGGAGIYSATFTNQTTISITAATHGLGTNCNWDPLVFTISGTVRTQFTPATYTCDKNDGAVSIGLAASTSGEVVLTLGGSPGSSGDVLGGSTLTNVGAIPRVTAAATLGEGSLTDNGDGIVTLNDPDGPNTLRIYPGSAQTSDTDTLLEFYNVVGTAVTTSILRDGHLRMQTSSFEGLSNDGTLQKIIMSGQDSPGASGLRFAHNMPMRWHPGQVQTGTSDVGLWRDGVGGLALLGETGLAAESLTNGALTGGTSWSAAGDFALAADAATYTHSTGTGTITQASGTLAIAGVANAWYAFTYTTTSLTGTTACTITTAFAAESTSVPTTTIGASTSTIYLKAAAVPGNFVLQCTSSAAATVTFDALSLKRITGGYLTTGAVTLPGGDVQTQLDARQPLDAELTALADYTVSTAGSAGTAATNMGTSTALARSDHEHLVPWQVGMAFEETPSTGEFAMPLPANNQCGAAMNVNSVSITALTKGTTFTFNIARYDNTGSTVGNLFSATQTYNTGGNTRQDFTPNQNQTGITNTDYFRVNIVSITGTDDFTTTVQGTCENR